MPTLSDASSKPKKQRLDVLLVERGLAPTRTQAQALIMAGRVLTGTTVLTKPGITVANDMDIVVNQPSPYVSRAGDKLASVAEVLKLNFQDAIVLDVGSSTGGFTDYSLQNGATKVYAVDVGTAQLAYKLQQDGRVVSMERTDIRDVEQSQLDPKPTIAVIDVSFISLTKILEHVAHLLISGSPIVAMAKPQFEAGKQLADRTRGVIADEKDRTGVLDGLELWLKSNGFTITASQDSAVAGAKGNRERFYLLTH